MDDGPSHLGVGLYSIADAARLSGALPETIRRWLCERGGVVPHYFPKDEKLLTFIELMEIHFIQMFRSEGVSLQTIRRTAKVLRERLETPYPFTVQRFDTDGRTIFATMMKERPKGVLIEDLERQQYVFRQIVRPFFRKLDYDTTDKSVSRFWPRHKRGRVVLDPARKFGKPIDAETGISTAAIYDAVTAGRGQRPEVVARWLGIPTAAVSAAIAFEKPQAA
jgi:uncharacterized protein (DUF433 family)